MSLPHNREMTTRSIPVNRAAVGLIAGACFAAAAMLAVASAWIPENSSLVLWQGGCVRIGLLMGAFWLALPGKHQQAAWTDLSPKTIGMMLLVFLLMTRIPLRVLLPGGLVVGTLLLFLRPRVKKRPV
ncbi:MAG: hypothetical protein U0872_11330 [Planctomycetaceae bacterium]